ncbi:tenascin-R-like [Diadema antillarum]|uniref:tenascin-R-like n=1 Tax=Diadema antillarum TaxID=105358 RepID=UPI003A87820B
MTGDLPTNEISINTVGTNSIEIIWNGTTDVDQYLVYYYQEDESVMVAEVPLSRNLNHRLTLSGLESGANYIINLVGLDENLQEIMGANFMAEQYTRPNPVSNLLLDPQGNMVNVTWTAPSTTFDGFRVCWYSLNETREEDLDPSERNYLWEVPYPDEEFVISVATYVEEEEDGDVLLSEKMTDFITLTQTSPLEFGEITPYRIPVSWDMIPGISEYVLSYEPADGDEPASQIINQPVASSNGLSRMYATNFTGLTPGRTYVFTLEWPLAFRVPTAARTTVPLPVFNASLSNVTSCSLMITWCLPDGDFDNVSISVEPTADVSVTNVSGMGGACRQQQVVELRQLQPMTSYNVTAEVVSGDARSEAVMVYAVSETRGGNIDVLYVSTSMVNISWSPVVGTDTFFVDIMGPSNNMTRNVTGVRQLSIADLEPGTQYTITVRWDFVCDLPSIQPYTIPFPPQNITFEDATVGRGHGTSLW